MTCFPLHCYEEREREILHRSEKGEKEKEPCEERERERERGKIQMGESVKLGLCMGFRVTKSDGVRETAWYARSSRENDWIGEKREKKRETSV